MKRVLICGDRNWKNYGIIFNRVVSLGKIGVIVEGGSRGADTIAKQVARALDIPVLEFKADWDFYGKTAGPIRNKRMLTEGKPNLVLAFCDDLEKSRGTKNMIEQARKAEIPIQIIRGGE